MKQSFGAIVESLENRQLNTVTAATFAGPQTKGTTWVYTDSQAAGYTITQTVVGTTKVGAYKATHVHITQSGTPELSEEYQVIDPKKGFLDLKEVDAAAGYVGTVTSSPFKIDCPPKLVAGKVYKGSYQRIESSTYAGKTTKGSTPFTFTTTLASNTRTPVVTPAGTFSCYKITTRTVNQNVKNGYLNDVYYIAPGVGMVEDVNTEYTPGFPSVTGTMLLQQFTAGA